MKNSEQVALFERNVVSSNVVQSNEFSSIFDCCSKEDNKAEEKEQDATIPYEFYQMQGEHREPLFCQL